MRPARTVCALIVAMASPALLSSQLPAYNIPDDPAFAFLGVSPKKVANPGTISALGVALADGIDIDGHINTGLALSSLLTNLIQRDPKPAQYRNGTPWFWLYNTQLSLATVRTSGDTGATDFGVGFRTIFRGPEPYADSAYLESMQAVLDRCSVESKNVETTMLVLEERTGVRPVAVRDPEKPKTFLPPTEGVPVTMDTVQLTYLDSQGNAVRREKVVIQKLRGGKPITEDTVRTFKPHANTLNRDLAIACGKREKGPILADWMERHWNDASLALSAATGTRFSQSSFRHGHSLGSGLWLLGAVPLRSRVRALSNFGQLAAQIHYATAAPSAPGAKASWDWGVRAMGGSARFNAFAELTRSLKKEATAPDARAWSAGVEYMAAASTWLSVGLGDRFSAVTSETKSFVFMNLKWGLARDPQLAAR
jgi:hypothetical protein